MKEELNFEIGKEKSYWDVQLSSEIYRVIRNDCRGFNNLSYTIYLR